MIWKQPATLEGLNALSKNTMVEYLGIEFTEIGENYLAARMPVDNRTVQPMRLLHGGASAALAETIGSTAATLCLENPSKNAAVGLEINANHLRSATKGYVYGTVKPFKIGRKIQVWNIEIHDEEHKLVCVSRLTIAVIDRSWKKKIPKSNNLKMSINKSHKN